MFLKYFLPTLSLLKAVDRQSFNYFVKKAAELAQFSVGDLFILLEIKLNQQNIFRFNLKVNKV